MSRFFQRWAVRPFEILLKTPLRFFLGQIIPSRSPRVFYGYERIPARNEPASGGIVKLQDLSEVYPNCRWRANTLYLISSCYPWTVRWQVRVARLFGAKIVLNQNGVAYPAWKPEGWEEENARAAWVHERADAVIYQSEFCRRCALEWLKVEEPDVSRVLLNPVDLEMFSPREDVASAATPMTGESRSVASGSLPATRLSSPKSEVPRSRDEGREIPMNGGAVVESEEPFKSSSAWPPMLRESSGSRPMLRESSGSRPMLRDGKPFRVLLAGTHQFAYRVRTALEALFHLDEDYRLIVAGAYNWNDSEDSALSEARGWADSLGVAERVEFRGRYLQSEAPALFSEVHVLLHTKVMDPCPRLVAEALASGLPVVYAASGGLPEMVSEEAGVGVESVEDFESENPVDSAGFADGIRKVCGDLERYAQGARRCAEERFDRGAWLEAHGEVFCSSAGMANVKLSTSNVKH